MGEIIAGIIVLTIVLLLLSLVIYISDLYSYKNFINQQKFINRISIINDLEKSKHLDMKMIQSTFLGFKIIGLFDFFIGRKFADKKIQFLTNLPVDIKGDCINTNYKKSWFFPKTAYLFGLLVFVAIFILLFAVPLLAIIYLKI